MKEPKGCPFCGSNSIRIWDGNHYWCQCNVCLASTAAEDTREEAVELWNRRTNDLDRVVEQLYSLKEYKNDYDSYHSSSLYHLRELENKNVNEKIDKAIEIVRKGGVIE